MQEERKKSKSKKRTNLEKLGSKIKKRKSKKEVNSWKNFKAGKEFTELALKDPIMPRKFKKDPNNYVSVIEVLICEEDFQATEKKLNCFSQNWFSAKTFQTFFMPQVNPVQTLQLLKGFMTNTLICVDMLPDDTCENLIPVSTNSNSASKF